MAGMSADFNIHDFGFPHTADIAGVMGQYTAYVDYSVAIDEAISFFDQWSVVDCPVDTGFLLSTISSQGSSSSASFSVDADYASYVEWGTWKTPSQPFFLDNIVGASLVAGYIGFDCYEEAKLPIYIEIEAQIDYWAGQANHNLSLYEQNYAIAMMYWDIICSYMGMPLSYEMNAYLEVVFDLYFYYIELAYYHLDLYFENLMTMMGHMLDLIVAMVEFPDADINQNIINASY